MAPYDWKWRTPLSWVEVGERQLFGLKLVDQLTNKIRSIRDKLYVTQDYQ